jgi:hypothetical protein
MTDRAPLLPFGSRRRRVAATLALAIASASLLATSASPSPPPTIVDSATGEITLTKDAPMASVPMHVRLGGPPPFSAQLSVSLERIDPQTGPAPLVMRVVDGSGEVISSGIDALIDLARETRLPACPESGPCEADYTLIALLADPDAGPITITWDADAGSRFANDKAPAGATISLEADAPIPVAADELRFASASVANLSLDAASPFLRRSFRVAMPATDPSRPLASGLVLMAPWRGDAQVVYLPPIAIDASVDGHSVLAQGRATSQSATFLPLTCKPACEQTYDLDLSWTGGDPAIGASTDLQLFAWALPATPDAEVSVTAAGSAQVGDRSASIRAPLHITRTIPAGGRIQDVLTATLDLSDAERGRPFHGYARLWMDATAPGAHGEEGRLEFSLGGGPNILADPGGPMRYASALIPLECVSGRCDVPIDVMVLPEGIHLPADVDLPLEIEFVTQEGTAIPPGATIDYAIAPKFPTP